MRLLQAWRDYDVVQAGPPSAANLLISPFHIRRAMVEDAPLVAHLGATTFHETYSSDNNPGDINDYITCHFTPAQIRREMGLHDSRFMLAEDRRTGEIVGCAKVRCLQPPSWVIDDAMELQRLYVLRSARGLGAGGALLRDCLRAALSSGWPAMWLGADTQNVTAVRFYRRFGFEIVGTQKFLLGSSIQSDLVMNRSLRYRSNTH